MNQAFLLVIAVVAVAVIAFLMRFVGGSRDESPRMPPPDPDAGEERPAAGEAIVSDEVDAGDEDGDGDDDTPEGLIAVSSDGLAFVPRRHSVLVTPASDVRRLLDRQRRRLSGDDAGGETPAFAQNAEEGQRASVHLQAGDLIATRVVKGAPYIEPWRLETLGRDRDLSDWAFETEEAARAAQETLELKVVRPILDEHGDPLPIGAEDFVAAEEERVRILEEFDRPDEDEEPPR